MGGNSVVFCRSLGGVFFIAFLAELVHSKTFEPKNFWVPEECPTDLPYPRYTLWVDFKKNRPNFFSVKEKLKINFFHIFYFFVFYSYLKPFGIPEECPTDLTYPRYTLWVDLKKINKFFSSKKY